MSQDDFEIIRGSGNIFRDLGHPDADREQLRALLAAGIIGVLDDRNLTGRFTIDRLMAILAGLGQEVEVTVEVHPRRSGTEAVERPLWSPVPV